ncbi:class I SAM-dependent methyltransferase [Aporhodopirellula aestuarii]|uniref:Class I SAM-dependent methyltransferase n=1 Tax=Aporhodopirellula aestuarii TaxID=2950107 RepID=A0ABT0TYY5_9BACT|nr:class I SAM-dependent methyltransferase [Aporhodopirellula aestuarii]MCM2369808.1 class I SAM-dependent methyltransferase [Aporhodopirellula aestuarii]
MPESPPDATESTPPESGHRIDRAKKATWRRPIGVSKGTWRYVHEGTIATRYDEFVATTPLCRVDLSMLADVFPDVRAPEAPPAGAEQTADSSGQGRGAEAQITPQKKWVFDLGCGTGRASEVLASHGYDVAAIDLSVPMLRQVTQRELNSVATIQANLVELDGIASGVGYGAVCLFSTLGMIQGRQNRRRFLSHVRRIVSPGGRFFLHVHHRYAALSNAPGIKQLATTALNSWTRSHWDFGDAVYAYRGLPDMFLHQFSRRELIADFSATGWRVDQWVNLSLDGSAVNENRWKLAGGFLIVVI